MSQRKAYPSDLTDAQWQILSPLVPAAKKGGRRANYERREIINAVLYLTRNGCSWRALPHDLPPWSLVHYYFWHWKQDGTWQSVQEHLTGDLRQKMGRERHPSAAVLDSQSVKTVEKGGHAATTRARRSRAASVTCS